MLAIRRCNELNIIKSDAASEYRLWYAQYRSSLEHHISSNRQDRAVRTWLKYGVYWNTHYAPISLAYMHFSHTVHPFPDPQGAGISSIKTLLRARIQIAYLEDRSHAP